MTERSPFIGILMLDTGFERFPGDVGNPLTFNYPVRYKIIEGATATRIVNVERPDVALVGRFVDAARELEADGAIGLISSCGFLSILQLEVANAVSIPVMLSSLNLIPLMQMSLGTKAIGVITADETQLSSDALKAVNIKPDNICIVGMQSSIIFTDFIFASSARVLDEALNKQGLCNDLIANAEKLLESNPDISALVLECTNLQPYAAILCSQLKLPVIGIVNAANFLWEISQPRQY